MSKRTDYRAKRIKPMLMATISRHSFDGEQRGKAEQMINEFCAGSMTYMLFQDDYDLKLLMAQSPKSQKRSRIAA